MISKIIVAILLLLVWTVFRETLLDKFWRYSKNNHLYNFGNLYVVLFCIIITFLISAAFF